jgi:hypothetical protein
MMTTGPGAAAAAAAAAAGAGAGTAVSMTGRGGDGGAVVANNGCSTGAVPVRVDEGGSATGGDAGAGEGT